MTSRYSADIILDAGSYAKSVFDSIEVDSRYYEGPDTILVRLDDHGIIRIEVRADRIPHMRAALNSVLRLAQAAEDTLRSTSGQSGGSRAADPPK